MSTPEQFALAALVAAGFVTQAKVDEAMALQPHSGAALTQGAGAAEPVAPAAWWIEKAEQFALPSKDGTRPFDRNWQPLYTAQQLQQAVARARAPYLQPDDKAALERLDECFEDGQEYDVPKPAMQRLAELGAVRHHSAGRYSITTFGRIVLGNPLYRYPLETLDECNDRLGREAAAIRAKGQQ